MSLPEIADLRAAYGRVEVLHGIDLRVDEGKIVAILGANGAGKTSFLRALCSAIPTTGHRRFDGIDLARRGAAAGLTDDVTASIVSGNARALQGETA